MTLYEEYHPKLKQFIKEVSNIVNAGGGEQVVTQAVAERLEDLLKHENILPSNYMVPATDHYVMYPVYVAPDNSFSIASAVWNVHQSTPIHDHGTWGVIGIVQGAEHEVRYMPSSNGNGIERLDDSIIRKGEVIVCCTSDQDVHQVSCASDVPCVGLHVYGGDIGRIVRRTYDPDAGEIKTFISEWATVPSSSGQ